MGKTLFTLELPCPRERKAQAPPARRHKDKKLYTSKLKHKKSPESGIFYASGSPRGADGIRPVIFILAFFENLRVMAYKELRESILTLVA